MTVPEQLFTTFQILILLSLHEVLQLACTLNVSLQLPSAAAFCQTSQVTEPNSWTETEINKKYLSS